MAHLTYRGKIIDAHAHIFNSTRADDLIQMERGYGYDNFCLQSLEAMYPGQNELCFRLREKTGCPVFAGLDRTRGDFAEQVRDMKSRGACGFKMIEGKPNVYKQYNEPLNSEQNMVFYAELERQRLPLLMHAGDPLSCWSKETAPAFAVENGWVYDAPGYPTFMEIRRQVEDIALQFPDLTLILAHFFFLSDEKDEAVRLLETHKNMYFDICPGTEMYVSFSKDTRVWREFFIRYADRLLFGTDNFDVEDQKDLLDKNEINRMIHVFLQTSDRFQVWDLKLQGINLPADVLNKIYHLNFQKLINRAYSGLSIL